MLKVKIFLAVFTALFLSSAIAGDEIDYSLNLKTWNSQISGCCNFPAANGSIVSGTAKKGDYFATASFLLPMEYTRYDGAWVSRRDADFALGWSVNSNISFLGGVKKVSSTSYDFSGSNTSADPDIMNISYLGVNGFSTISEKTFVYGTVLRSLKVTQTEPHTTTTFYSYEAGLGYLLERNVQISAGFRSQHIDNTDKTTLQGFIFGFGYNF